MAEREVKVLGIVEVYQRGDLDALVDVDVLVGLDVYQVHATVGVPGWQQETCRKAAFPDATPNVEPFLAVEIIETDVPAEAREAVEEALDAHALWAEAGKARPTKL